ncbi:hypothetical protein B0A81_02015 [Flavobacterium plurextorum]|uniref:Uncharacterized protein n=1 Tax=Flavobacterium plurextorum TaxID=1114867 RepID=A0ABX4CZE0_9FLAO|nr:hypothetical protein B0A81_02015 [Flavobacterium plurextorum]
MDVALSFYADKTDCPLAKRGLKQIFNFVTDINRTVCHSEERGIALGASQRLEIKIGEFRV